MLDYIKSRINQFREFVGWGAVEPFAPHGVVVPTPIPVDTDAETVWASAGQIATILGVEAIQVEALLSDLCEADQIPSTAISLCQHANGTREAFYSLDAVLTVGYRLNGPRAVEFRKWAGQILRSYVEKGFALDESRLREDGEALLNAAYALRVLRTEERSFHAQVTALLSSVATDYDPGNKQTKTFFAEAQNIWHFAATGKTATEIIVERADAERPMMGLTSLGNEKPKSKDVTVAKNYCTQLELNKLRLISEQFLLYAEGMALRDEKRSMTELMSLLRMMVGNFGWPVLPRDAHIGRPSRKNADSHAQRQRMRFNSSNRAA